MVALGVFLIGLALGLRGSIRLTSRLRSAWPVMDWRERLLLTAIVVVVWTVTAFALYIGFMSLRRALGYAPLDWAPIVGAIFAGAVLYIPAFLDLVVDRVARVEPS